MAETNKNWRGESMSVKSSLSGNRKGATMRQRQADALLRSSIKDGGRRSSAKGVLVIDVGGTSVKILASGQTEFDLFGPAQRSLPGGWFRE